MGTRRSLGTVRTPLNWSSNIERLIDDQSLLFPARRLPAHGLAAWAEVQRRGYEGLVAKDESSAYRSGRTRAWLKVKLREEDGRVTTV